MISALTATALFLALAGIHRYVLQQLIVTDLEPLRAILPKPLSH